MINNFFQILHKYEPNNISRSKWFFIIWCIIMIIFREPNLIIQPRIWAEEGSIFYSWATNHSFIENFSSALVGYYTGFNFFVAFLQSLFPIDYIASISTWVGFLIQLIPIYIILNTDHPIWNRYYKKVILVIFYLLITPPELMLNTTNSHFIFGLISFQILVIPTENLTNYQKWFFRVLLLIGCLSGPSSCFFAPLFLVKAYQNNSKENKIQASIVLASTMIQFYFILKTILYENQYGRLQVFNFSYTFDAFIRDNFGCGFDLMGLNDKKNFGLFILCLSIIIFYKNRKNIVYQYFIYGFVITSILSTLGSLNMAGSLRYSFIPTFMLICIFLNELYNSNENNNWIFKITYLILIVTLTSNILTYRTSMNSVYKDDYPIFSNEIEKWKLDRNYNIKIHPLTDDFVWEIDLNHSKTKSDLKFFKPIPK